VIKIGNRLRFDALNHELPSIFSSIFNAPSVTMKNFRFETWKWRSLLRVRTGTVEMAEVFRNSSVEMWKWPKVWDLLYTLRSTEDRAAAGSLGLTSGSVRITLGSLRISSDQFRLSRKLLVFNDWLSWLT
jgi:hypothetical protein